jgi:hypothetical protein
MNKMGSTMQRERFIYELKSVCGVRSFCLKSPELVFVGAPIERRKNNSPKLRRRRIKLKGNVKSFAHLPASANDLARDALARTGVLQHEPSSDGQALLHHNQGALRADALRKNLKRRRFPLQRHVNIGAHAEQHSLSAAPFLA